MRIPIRITVHSLNRIRIETYLKIGVLGSGIYITFFNGLSANVMVAVPLTGGNFKGDNVYLNLGFNIPILEYLGALNQ